MELQEADIGMQGMKSSRDLAGRDEDEADAAARARPRSRRSGGRAPPRVREAGLLLLGRGGRASAKPGSSSSVVAERMPEGYGADAGAAERLQMA
jgi:hypothetical protein